MDLMKQCQIWHENDEFLKIIDAIEDMPDNERTPEMISELARAYNNIASEQDVDILKKAISLLESVREYFEDDHCWNYRMAYAYYYLNDEATALYYFEKALEARPGDEDTEEFIESCRKILTVPRFAAPFKQRVEYAWNNFAKGESELRRLIDLGSKEASEELVEKCTEMLSPAFCNVGFELGCKNKKYELILVPEGNTAKLFEYVYFQQHAPKSVLKNWNILVGRQPSKGFALNAFEQTIQADDIQIWVENAGDKPENTTFSIEFYCEKLKNLLSSDKDKVLWMFGVMLDQVLGELQTMKFVERYEALSEPKNGDGTSLEDLPEIIKNAGINVSNDLQWYMDNSYIYYEAKPVEDKDADDRLDIFCGVTRCPTLINEYYDRENYAIDDFHRDGIVAGYFCYPLDCFEDSENRSSEILDFRESAENAILKLAGEDAVIFIGGATGIYWGYIDFIAWNLEEVLNVAKLYFKNAPMDWVGFHTFRRDVGGVYLKHE